MKNLSAGNYALATLCQWWLTDEAEHEKTPPTDRMRFGNAVHSVIETALHGQFIDAVELRRLVSNSGLKPSWDKKVQARFDAWFGRFDAWSHLKPEIAFAYNVNTEVARRLEGESWRKYADVDRTCEVTLVIDAHSLADGWVDVYDWKTGRLNEQKDVQQIRACAMVAAKFYGVDRAVAHVVYIEDDDVCDFKGGFPIDEFDMASMGSTLRGVFKLADVEPKLGPHCKTLYCPAMKSCSKKLIGGT